MQTEIKNRNGRVYPRSVMESALNRYMIERVNIGKAYGELGHPDSPKLHERNVSHLITELKFQGNDVYGKARIGGPEGDAAKKLIELGGTVGVSSRGLGSLKENRAGIMEVQNDFYIATAGDIVLDPSAPSAFVKGIMEGVEWFYNPLLESWEAQKIDDVKKKIKTFSRSELEEKKIKLFEFYMKNVVKSKKI